MIYPSEYLTDGVQKQARKEMLDKAIKYLTRRTQEFDTIVFQGISGALVGPTLADQLDKYLLVVRKETDGSTHSSRLVEGEIGNRLLIVDDFVANGTTVAQIVEKVKLASIEAMRRDLYNASKGLSMCDNPNTLPQFVGVFTWNCPSVPWRFPTGNIQRIPFWHIYDEASTDRNVGQL